VLFRYRFPKLARIVFSTKSGELAVTREGALLNMDFPARPGKPVAWTDALAAALGARPRAAYLARDLLAIFDAESEVRSLRPDLRASRRSMRSPSSCPRPATRWTSCRAFSRPGAGVPEDPVTGSSHCHARALLGRALGKNHLTAQQLSAARGDLLCELRASAW